MIKLDRPFQKHLASISSLVLIRSRLLRRRPLRRRPLRRRTNISLASIEAAGVAERAIDCEPVLKIGVRRWSMLAFSFPSSRPPIDLGNGTRVAPHPMMHILRSFPPPYPLKWYQTIPQMVPCQKGNVFGEDWPPSRTTPWCPHKPRRPRESS